MRVSVEEKRDRERERERQRTTCQVPQHVVVNSILLRFCALRSRFFRIVPYHLSRRIYFVINVGEFIHTTNE
mgnify:CR=1